MKGGSNRKIELWILINQVGICQDNGLGLTRRMGARSSINKILAIFYQTFDSIICNNLHANYMNLSFDGLRCGAFCYKSCAWLIYLRFSFFLFCHGRMSAKDDPNEHKCEFPMRTLERSKLGQTQNMWKQIGSGTQHTKDVMTKSKCTQHTTTYVFTQHTYQWNKLPTWGGEYWNFRKPCEIKKKKVNLIRLR